MLDTEIPETKSQNRVLFPGPTLSEILGKSRTFKKNKIRSWAIPLGVIVSLTCSVFFITRIDRLERKIKIMHQKMKMLSYNESSKLLGHVSIPAKLANVPLGEASGLVLGVKTIEIRNVTAPYNPSIVKSDRGYDLFFRYDVISSKIKYMPYSSRIGVVPLNKEFNQEKNEFTRIDLQTEYAEDPRVVYVGDQLYLFFNQLDPQSCKSRYMTAANIDSKTYRVNYSTILDLNLQWIEKNWNPFEYIGEDQKPRLFLEYRLLPHKLFALPNPKVNEIVNINCKSWISKGSIFWSDKWGEMRPGAPAQKIGNEYLAFFHSSFFDERTKLYWYVMGAYTFEAVSPFRITGVSSYPILFEGIYETPIVNTASMEKRVIFPSGYVIENQKDKDVIHLAAGENDSSVKIITIDKDKLIQGMERFEN